jgi:hypothetical protein
VKKMTNSSLLSDRRTLRLSGYELIVKSWNPGF